MRKRILRSVSLITVLTLCLLSLGKTHVAVAQGGVVWSRPILLSNPRVNAWAPTIAADQTGNLHVMWSQTMTDPPPPGEGDTLFYTRWDGQQWTPTVDVLVSPEGSASAPELAVTPDGMLHAVWHTGGSTAQLMYAHAPACCADNPSNWSQPKSLGSPVRVTTALIADEKGSLHVAFPSIDTQGVVYRRSDDGGKTWPIWVDITDGLKSSDDYAMGPRLAVDGHGRVHLVWAVLPWPGRAVVYARSDDGGDTWGESQILDTDTRKEYLEGYGPMDIDIEAKGDQVHVIWDGAPTVERTHIWSSDGGQTWSPMGLLFPSVTKAGRGSWNDMAVDSAGTFHAISLHANSNALHSAWNGTTWSVPDQLPTRGPVELLRVTITQGNIVNVVYCNKASRPFTDWYVQGKIAAPITPTKPWPTPESAMALTPTVSLPVPATMPTLPPFQQATDSALSQPSPAAGPATGVVAGVLSTLVLLSISLVITLGRKRQR